MKVKNGIASSSSFDMMPKIRYGQRLQEADGEVADLDGDYAEEQSERGERERDRKAERA